MPAHHMLDSLIVQKIKSKSFDLQDIKLFSHPIDSLMEAMTAELGPRATLVGLARQFVRALGCQQNTDPLNVVLFDGRAQPQRFVKRV